MHTLQELRTELGFTQAKFAEAIGRTSPLISLTERGFQDLGGETALLIAENRTMRKTMKTLDITVEDLLRGFRSRAA